MFVSKIYKVLEMLDKIKTNVDGQLLVIKMKTKIRYILLKLNFNS